MGSIFCVDMKVNPVIGDYFEKAFSTYPKYFKYAFALMDSGS
jgi:hypothetical protein